jgi:N-acetylglutamate synthase-like GNAT family acetyltransferase
MRELEIKIRRGKLKDISQIYNLGKHAKELEFSKKMNFHDKVELKEFVTKTKDNILLVSISNKKVIGFLYAKIVSRTWCILDNLVVDEKFREEGIGSLLLEDLYKILKNKKVNYIQILEDIHHKKTREFWKKKGFKEEKKFIWADKRI